ncbi:MAG: hypothetical protein KF789_14470, partial [Bdellovibrionaceae bacterium]|nr:hypothetical protein [Pseudobdellovibrionaceae bacterium]
MNQRLWIAAALTATSLTACGTLERRQTPQASPPPQESGPVTPNLEQELRGETANTSATETTAPVSNDTSSAQTIPSTMSATPAGTIGHADEVSIILKDKNGKIVKGAAPSTLGGPAPAMPTTGSSLAKADAVVLPPPNSDIATAPVPSEPLVTDTDFEITKASQRVPGKIKGDQALLWLKNGNKRFTKGLLRKDGQSKKDIKRLIASEQPHAVILSCSDSRTPPEVVFDQKLGEIYVVRTAGPSLDSAVIASLEDAVERLGVNLLVVMGHSSCESIKTAMGGRSAKSPHQAHSIAAMSLRLKAFSRRPASAGLKEESWTNVSGVTQELLE